jgi:hypothetical protein
MRQCTLGGPVNGLPRTWAALLSAGGPETPAGGVESVVIGPTPWKGNRAKDSDIAQKTKPHVTPSHAARRTYCKRFQSVATWYRFGRPPPDNARTTITAAEVFRFAEQFSAK